VPGDGLTQGEGGGVDHRTGGLDAPLVEEQHRFVDQVGGLGVGELGGELLAGQEAVDEEDGHRGPVLVGQCGGIADGHRGGRRPVDGDEYAMEHGVSSVRDWPTVGTVERAGGARGGQPGMFPPC
jgi:hypothetical protein